MTHDATHMHARTGEQAADPGVGKQLVQRRPSVARVVHVWTPARFVHLCSNVSIVRDGE